MTDLPDYKKIDYRGFAFVVHPQHGMLLLHCTRKPKKGPHFQLPGGHIDDFEFEIAKEKSNQGRDILIEAAKMGTARELYEETGIDVRDQLERLTPVILKDNVQSNKGKIDLENMLDGKLYFNLNVSNEDFLTDGEKVRQDESIGVQSGIIGPMDANGKHLKLKISHEHSGFIFENNPLQSIEKIAKHSGGAGSAALRMAMNRGMRKEPTRSRQQQNAPRKISNSVQHIGNGRHPVDLLKPHRVSPPRGFFSFCRDCC